MPLSADFYFLLVFWLVGFFLMWRIPSFKNKSKLVSRMENSSERDWPSISIIIPARNEENNIDKLLATLSRQSVRPLEIIVVDDESADQTCAIAVASGATLVSSEPLPEGWTGKNWACWRGAERASGEILLFLDADVWLAVDGLERLIQVYAHGGGLLTVQPYHVTKRSYEQLSAFFNIVLMAGLNAFTPLGDKIEPSGAFGPCLMCSRDDYFSTGGHEGVKAEVLESIKLAGAFKDRGLPVWCYGGWGAIYFRMYPEGLGELIEGWSKGFGTGALSIRFPFFLMTIAWVTGCFGATIGLIKTFRLPYSLNPIPLFLLYMLYGLQVWWILRRIGNFAGRIIVTYPMPLLFFAVIMLRSLIMVHLLGRVQWRGRMVQVAPMEDEKG
jgi:4,4'-diaponeurosporenoate glycosyltransferase